MGNNQLGSRTAGKSLGVTEPSESKALAAERSCASGQAAGGLREVRGWLPLPRGEKAQKKITHRVNTPNSCVKRKEQR